MGRIIFLLLILVFTFWPSYGQGSSKVGVVDGEKLFDEYPNAQEASKKIADAQDELRNAISESEKIYTEFEKQKKSEAEKLTKQKELQAKIDTKAQETKKMVEAISAKIEDEILQAIRKIAFERGLDVVFDKRAVLTGGVDVTQAVSEQLKKKIPIADRSLDLKDNKEKKKEKTN